MEDTERPSSTRHIDTIYCFTDYDPMEDTERFQVVVNVPSVLSFTDYDPIELSTHPWLLHRESQGQASRKLKLGR
jgi:hypothetical protein